MCSSSVNPCCHVQTFKSFWRRKWYSLIGASLALSIILIVIRQYMYAQNILPPNVERDTYLDNVVKEVYEDVLNTWYNFTDDAQWFNGKTLTPDSKDWDRYLTELRRDWILSKYNPSKSYNLEEPDIEDQSMGQAEVIRKVLKNKRNGFFVECGAFDGETRSNTLVLERQLGWTGLLVEADPINFSKMLVKNRNAYLTPTCLGITPYPTTMSFLMAKNVGRLHEPNASDSHLPNSPDVAHSGVHITAQCFPFIHYMIALNVTTVNYFSLDIEGHELEVLKTIPFDKINIETLSVEFAHVESGKRELTDFMESKGYYVYSFVVRTDHLAHDIIFTKSDYRDFDPIE